MIPNAPGYIEVEVQTDNYAGETSWTVTDTASSSVVASRSDYNTANKFYSDSYCLAAAEYTFTINDTWGGMSPLSYFM